MNKSNQIGPAGTPCNINPDCQLTIGHDGLCELPPTADELRANARALINRADDLDRKAGKP